jgi:multiple sugar transport system permease protein
MAVTATICLLFSLNEFLFAAVLTSFNAKTATVAVYGYLGQDRLDWELMTATSVLVMLPVLLLAFAVRRYLVSGLTLGALSE